MLSFVVWIEGCSQNEFRRLTIVYFGVHCMDSQSFGEEIEWFLAVAHIVAFGAGSALELSPYLA